MRWKTIFAICVLVLIYLCGESLGGASGRQNIPESIRPASRAVVRLRVGGKGSSSVRVAKDLFITSAHSLYGYDANDKPEYIAVEFRGKQYEVEKVESGRFNPNEGHMADWALLKLKPGTKLHGDIAVAQLATGETMNRILTMLGDFAGKEPCAPIWSISYPVFTIRPYPIEGSNGKNVFLSRGCMLSNLAYKKHILFAAERSQIYDANLAASPPPFDIDVNKSWKSLKKDPNFRGVYQLYELYKADGDPILYHTADFSNGSSGGGFFDEKTGEFIGLVSMGTHLGPRNVANYGIGGLYRIDAICGQSIVLRNYGLCQSDHL